MARDGSNRRGSETVRLLKIVTNAAFFLFALTPVAMPAQQAKTGEQVYATCTACHMADGAGMPGLFPPLAGSEWVTGRPELPIAIVLHGMQGEVTVKGMKYSGVMTPWAAMYSDAEIANVVTYIRAKFGNSASAVTSAQVSAVRAATKERKTMWTATELRTAFP